MASEYVFVYRQVNFNRIALCSLAWYCLQWNMPQIGAPNASRSKACRCQGLGAGITYPRSYI
jgi:hypothetical protein